MCQGPFLISHRHGVRIELVEPQRLQHHLMAPLELIGTDGDDWCPAFLLILQSSGGGDRAVPHHRGGIGTGELQIRADRRLRLACRELRRFGLCAWQALRTALQLFSWPLQLSRRWRIRLCGYWSLLTGSSGLPGTFSARSMPATHWCHPVDLYAVRCRIKFYFSKTNQTGR